MSDEAKIVPSVDTAPGCCRAAVESDGHAHDHIEWYSDFHAIRRELEDANERIKTLLGDRDKARRLLVEHADCDDPHCAAEIALALGRPETAPAASSEPVPDGPRVWELPVIPADVMAVRDQEGMVWHRAEEPERWWERADGRRISAESRLIDERGPLTEVVEESTP